LLRRNTSGMLDERRTPLDGAGRGEDPFGTSAPQEKA
jgi:hypothetical protein